MKTIRVTQLEIIYIIVLAAAVGLAGAYVVRNPHMSSKLYLPIVQQTQYNTDDLQPTPSLLPLNPQAQEVSEISPDGTKKVIMSVTSNAYTKTYSFSTANEDGSSAHRIYIATSSAQAFSIPFNTWSPDDRYVFLTDKTASGEAALAMRADGEPFGDGEPFMNVSSIFTERNLGNTYKETIGWASNTLLIVNSTAPDGAKGPSYWFEVPNKAVIELSSQF